MPASVTDYGAAGDPRSGATSLTAWATAVAAALDGDDTTVDARVSAHASDTTAHGIDAKVDATGGTFYAATPRATYGAELAPALDAWTPGGGASYAGGVWTVPVGGYLAATVSVTSGEIYLLQTAHDPGPVYVLTVSVGAASETLTTDGALGLTLTAADTGSVTLQISAPGGAWAASNLSAISFKQVTATPTAVQVWDGDTAVTEMRAFGTTFALGNGHAQLLGSFGTGTGFSLSAKGGYGLTAVGTDAQRDATAAFNSTAIGYLAQSALNYGHSNTGIGAAAQQNLDNGFNNTAVGSYAQASLTYGIRNEAFGRDAQRSLTSGGFNTHLGSTAGYSLTTGTYNVGVGYQAQDGLVSGDSNTAIGANAQQVATGSYNTAVGRHSAYGLTSGQYQTAIGQRAGFTATTGSYNTFLGAWAGYYPNNVSANSTTTGGYQTCVGYQSGQSSSSAAQRLTTLGYRAVGHTNALAIGANTSAAAAGAGAIGTDSTNVGASSSTANEIALGTALHTVRVAGLLRLDQGQTTVGAAGGASALPATPSKYLSIVDSTGTEYVVPVYAKA